MSDVFLYFITFSWGSTHKYRIAMPDMETCISAVASSRSHISQGDENEAGVVMFCGGERMYWSNNQGNWSLREVPNER